MEAPSSTPTPAESGAVSLDELWQREQRIEKALMVLAPKVDVIMKALKEGEARAKAAANQPLPPVPQQGQKSVTSIPADLITKGIDVIVKAFSGPEPDTTRSLIEKKLVDKAIDNILVTVDNDRAIGEAIRTHVKKHGLKGIIKFGETE